MFILLIGGLVVVVGLCLAIEAILARLPLPREARYRRLYDRRAAEAAFKATVAQEDRHLIELQQATRHLR